MMKDVRYDMNNKWSFIIKENKDYDGFSLIITPKGRKSGILIATTNRLGWNSLEVIRGNIQKFCEENSQFQPEKLSDKAWFTSESFIKKTSGKHSLTFFFSAF